MMFRDADTAKEELFDALDAMAKTLRTAEDVETRHLERLLRDRNELLAGAHFSYGIPVLELAARTGIAWTLLYDVIDAVREESRRKSSVWGSLVGAPSAIVNKPADEEKDEEEEP